MKPAKSLPPDYTDTQRLDFNSRPRLLILLNLTGLALFFFSAALFSFIGVRLRSGWLAVSAQPLQGKMEISMTWVGLLILSYILVLVLHELAHGLGFWLLTRQRPHFGFRGAYAFAAAPDWYLPRTPYLFVGLAPLLLLTPLGLLPMPFVSADIFVLLVFALAANTSGAVGDLYAVAWLLRQPGAALVNDQGDAITVYRQAVP